MRRGDQTPGQAAGRLPALRWPTRLLGPRPGLKEINLVCWGSFVVFLVIPVGVILCIHARMGSDLIRGLHSDFTYFYGIGRIVNEYSTARVYDYHLQQKIFNEIYPLQNGVYGPSPYPPFVALVFSCFARLPFDLAYLLWGVISLLLYFFGLRILSRQFALQDRYIFSIVLCLALAFFPFFFETLVNAQLAAVAFFAVSVAISQDRAGKFLQSGLALSFLTYKPTLLLLLLPMLFLTRRFRTLIGFVSGVALIVFLTTAIAGIDVWAVYGRFLIQFSRVAGIGGHSTLQLWQYVDLNSFSSAAMGGRTPIGSVILIAAVVATAAWLAYLLWKSKGRGIAGEQLAWAATLTWTLLINVYVPMYDCLLVVIALILSLSALKELAWSTAGNWMVLLSLLLFAFSWITEAFARRHGIQIISILLVILGLAQLCCLQSLLRERQGTPA
jgi:hypothetical protein